MKTKIVSLFFFLAAFLFAVPTSAFESGSTSGAEEAAAPAMAPDAGMAEGEADQSPAKGTTSGAAAEAASSGGDQKASGDSDATAATGAATEASATTEALELKSEEEAAAAASNLWKALQKKEWAAAVGLALALLVFVMRKAKLLTKVPKKALPWVAAGMGVAGYVAAALMSGGASMSDAVLAGLMAGTSSVGLWEMVLKGLLGSMVSQESEA